MSRLTGLVVLLGIVGGVALASVLAPKVDSYQTCVSNKAELDTVAEITNATGQLPGGVRLATGEKVSVNPNLCKATFDAPKTLQTEARELQGNNNDFQVGVNPQQ